MKTLQGIGLLATLALAATTASAQEPDVSLVQAGVTAYNERDLAYFEEHLADDVVWLDEDGHVMDGKASVLGFLRLQFDQTPRRTLTVSDVRIGSTTDAAWATFSYMIMGGEAHIEGLETTVFRRVGDDWRIVVVHGAFNTEGHH